MGVWHRFLSLLREDFADLFSASSLRLKKENYLRLLLYFSFFIFTLLAFWPAFFGGKAIDSPLGKESRLPYKNKGFESLPRRPHAPSSAPKDAPAPAQKKAPRPERFAEII